MQIWQAASLVEHPGHPDQSVHGRLRSTGLVIGSNLRNPAVKVVSISRTTGKKGRDAREVGRTYHPGKASLKRVGRLIRQQTKAGAMRRVSGFNFGNKTKQVYAVSR